MQFVVPGEPVPKKRPRVLRNGHVFTPRETLEYESSVAWMARATGQKFEAGKPLRLEVDFFCSPVRRQWTPDTDNLIKSILDGIETSGVIDNDVDIVAILAYRWEDNNPRAEVKLEYV